MLRLLRPHCPTARRPSEPLIRREHRKSHDVEGLGVQPRKTPRAMRTRSRESARSAARRELAMKALSGDGGADRVQAVKIVLFGMERREQGSEQGEVGANPDEFQPLRRCLARHGRRSAPFPGKGTRGMWRVQGNEHADMKAPVACGLSTRLPVLYAATDGCHKDVGKISEPRGGHGREAGAGGPG